MSVHAFVDTLGLGTVSTKYAPRLVYGLLLASIKLLHMSLSLDQFRMTLRTGHGRALLQMRANPGAPDFGAALLDACLHNACYDAQAEPLRGPWLFQMLRMRSDYPWLRERALAGLASSESGSHDQDQHISHASMRAMAA